MSRLRDKTIGVLRLIPLSIRLLAAGSTLSVILQDLFLSKIPEIFYLGHELGQIWRSLALSIMSAFILLFFIEGANRKKKLYFLIERQVGVASICAEIHTLFALIAWSIDGERKDPEEDFDNLETYELLEAIDPVEVAPAVFYLKCLNYRGTATWLDFFEQISLYFEEESKSLEYGSFLLEPEVIVELHAFKKASADFREALPKLRFVIENNIDYAGASYLASNFAAVKNAADSLHLAMAEANGLPKYEFESGVNLNLLILQATMSAKFREQNSNGGRQKEGLAKE